VYGANPKSPISLTFDDLTVDKTASLLSGLQSAWNDAKNCLVYAQAQYSKFAKDDRSFRDFKPGDFVLLRRSPLRKNPKLSSHWVGPHCILDKNSHVNDRLELLPGSQMHQLFMWVGFDHTTLLKP